MGYPSDPYRKPQEQQPAFGPPPPDPYGPRREPPPSGQDPYGPRREPPALGHDPYGRPAYAYPQPRRHSGLVLALAIGLPLLLLGGCATACVVLTAPGGGTNVSATSGPLDLAPPAERVPPPVQEPAERPPEQPAEQPPEQPAEQPAEIGGEKAPLTGETGRTLTLKGMQEGSIMDVTVDQVFREVQTTYPTVVPRSGNRLMAVQITLTNKSSLVYRDTPHSGASVVDSQDQEYEATWEELANGRHFKGTVTIEPGDSGTGLVVFQVPEKAEVVTFTFGLDGGWAEQHGRWKLR
ncbi:DUF4352 domain-containing protein [Nonomuraea terrae]|uniref:DUF4352 domain-containing protein n=1 Tax=Nonomuraea terrae TaxID=2530383 RepID=A0A4V6PDK2_9ACTN|nr:DUF4352 domain-containing protein [Nonomuraea terrae]TDD37207.1 DUF4352 domain-containing protein [Nonomuraea terrae]